MELAVLRSPALTEYFALLGIAPQQRLLLSHEPDPRYDAGRALGGAESKIERPLTANLSSWLAVPVLRANANTMLMTTAIAGIGDWTFSARRAWVRAIAARQTLHYAQDVMLAAEVSRNLTQRMRQLGSSSPIDTLRSQQFLDQSMARSTRAQAHAMLEREQLLQWMGLWGTEAERVQLPDRLPDLPVSALGPEGLEALALSQRLDAQIARAALVHDNNAAGEPASAHVLPQAALDQIGVRARSEVRSSWIAYQAQLDLARHACEVGVPLAQRITAEQIKRYNGMLASVFDLIADAAGSVRAVSECVAAQADFWLAEVDLQQALAGIGRLPFAAGSLQPAPENSAHPLVH
ncbi:MAG: copper resistance protein [Herminiimonas sp.]|nr:copper resistance protein [Herminiimonas sp.]